MSTTKKEDAAAEAGRPRVEFLLPHALQMCVHMHASRSREFWSFPDYVQEYRLNGAELDLLWRLYPLCFGSNCRRGIEIGRRAELLAAGLPPLAHDDGEARALALAEVAADARRVASLKTEDDDGLADTPASGRFTVEDLTVYLLVMGRLLTDPTEDWLRQISRGGREEEEEEEEGGEEGEDEEEDEEQNPWRRRRRQRRLRRLRLLRRRRETLRRRMRLVFAAAAKSGAEAFAKNETLENLSVPGSEKWRRFFGSNAERRHYPYAHKHSSEPETRERRHHHHHHHHHHHDDDDDDWDDVED